MDLELQHTLLEGYQMNLDMVLSQEETLESIVPDSFPDVSRIVSTTGTACLTTKQLNNGSIKIMGTASICVLYVPEEAAGLRALTIKVPFQCNGADPKIKDTDLLQTAVLSVAADTRLINPRKLFIKTEVKLGAKVFSRSGREVVCDLASKDDLAIQKQWQNTKHFAVTAVLEKTFLFSDTLRQSSSKPDIDELLTYSVVPNNVEARYIGKKLVCKGEMILSALCFAAKELNEVRFELPFSQILDLESSFDEGEPDVSVYLKNSECTLRDGELDVTVEAVFQACLWSHKDVTVLCDMYSTSTKLEVERTASAFCVSFERESRRETARKFCESGIPAKQVLSSTLSFSPIVTRQHEHSIECSTEGNVCILYLSEDHALCAVDYSVPIKNNMECPDGCSCKCSCRPIGDLVAVPVTGGFEVRFEVEFEWIKTEQKEIQHVLSVKDSNLTVVPGLNPSVIIRMVGSGESLWDIAKSCCSTIPDICVANELSSEMVPPGKILLIPTKR